MCELNVGIMSMRVCLFKNKSCISCISSLKFYECGHSNGRTENGRLYALNGKWVTAHVLRIDQEALTIAFNVN